MKNLQWEELDVMLLFPECTGLQEQVYEKSQYDLASHGKGIRAITVVTQGYDSNSPTKNPSGNRHSMMQ